MFIVSCPLNEKDASVNKAVPPLQNKHCKGYSLLFRMSTTKSFGFTGFVFLGGV